MIYDNIENVGKYRNITKWFAYAADFLKDTDLSSLPDGRTEIMGDHVFINVMDADTKQEDEVQFEVHKKYWDVQIDIEGTEMIQVSLEPGVEKTAYDPGRDIGFYQCDRYVSCTMGPGRFIICMNEEPHRPTLNCAGQQHVRKCVIKVEAENQG